MNIGAFDCADAGQPLGHLLVAQLDTQTQTHPTYIFCTRVANSSGVLKPRAYTNPNLGDE